MSNFIQQMVTNKLRHLSADELLYYAQQYNFSISRHQAKAITAYLRQHPSEPFNADGRTKMFHELTRITDKETAQKARKLFHKIVKTYGLEDSFN